MLHKIGHATQTQFHCLQWLQTWLIRQVHRYNGFGPICAEPSCQEGLELSGRARCGDTECWQFSTPGAVSLISVLPLFTAIFLPRLWTHWRNTWPGITDENSFIWKANKLLWVKLGTIVTAAYQLSPLLMWSQNLLAAAFPSLAPLSCPWKGWYSCIFSNLHKLLLFTAGKKPPGLSFWSSSTTDLSDGSETPRATRSNKTKDWQDNEVQCHNLWVPEASSIQFPKIHHPQSDAHGSLSLVALLLTCRDSVIENFNVLL